jgi:hypothetical protein
MSQADIDQVVRVMKIQLKLTKTLRALHGSHDDVVEENRRTEIFDACEICQVLREAEDI